MPASYGYQVLHHTGVTTVEAPKQITKPEPKLSPLEQYLQAVGPKPKGPKFNNQRVVRSTGRDTGYRYNDWRNW
jgi:hypothetical protein